MLRVFANPTTPIYYPTMPFLSLNVLSCVVLSHPHVLDCMCYCLSITTVKLFIIASLSLTKAPATMP